MDKRDHSDSLSRLRMEMYSPWDTRTSDDQTLEWDRENTWQSEELGGQVLAKEVF